MFALLCSLIRLLVLPGSVREMPLGNLALRQQLTVLKRHYPRPRLQKADRLFWLYLSRNWKNWRRALIIVRPETVVSWHRKGFRLFWTWISSPEAQRSPRNQP
jgi:putative transposase